MPNAESKLIELVNLLPRFTAIKQLLEHDLEAFYILKRITDFFDKVSKQDNAQEDEISYLTQALQDRCWERIHSGHFSTVPLTTRKIYALCCYFKIFILLLRNSSLEERDKCCTIMDEAELLGCTTDLFETCDVLKCALSKYLSENASRNSIISLPILAVVERREARCDVPQLDAPSVQEFRIKCYQTMQPTLLFNTIQHWPALRKWNDLNYLLKVAGNRTVPIEIGSNYASDEWSQQLVKIRDFLFRQFGNSKNINQKVEYLAQHELFAQIPNLKKDIYVPDYCTACADSPASVDIKAWLGPSDTISPMHYDHKHNLLCQVFGAKRIIIASPADTDNLYPHASEFLSNTSQIDAAKPDYERFPLLKKVRFRELLLQPGDCLYLPPNWWHYVRAETPSFSVSFWWK